MKPLTTNTLASQDLMEELKGRRGYLPYQMIEAACHHGYIHSEVPIEPSQFQPVSLDLRLGPKAYRIQCSFLPENDAVEEKLKDVNLYEFDISGDGGVLEKGAIYLIPLMEELRFPSSMFGLANPKSSTGRLDMFTRVIIDRGHRFDEIRKEYKGKMYLEIIPRSFPVKVQAGLSLNQLRIGVVASATLGNQGLEPEYKKNPILFDGSGFAVPYDSVKIKDGIYIGVELSGKTGEDIIAYKAKTNSSVIDLSKVNHYDPEDFWEPIPRTRNDRLILEPECFYIMTSKEKICIAPNLLAEMVAYEPNSGELRTHYAGFFDPGFGWTEDQSFDLGTHAVMEVRPHDVPFMVEDGQTFCRLKFEKVVERPVVVYGKQIHSNYHSQRLTLSKYFKNGRHNAGE